MITLVSLRGCCDHVNAVNDCVDKNDD